MGLDDRDRLEELVDTYGLQTVLESIADLCTARGGPDWARASRKVRELASLTTVEAVS